MSHFERGSGDVLTCYEDIFVWGSNELYCFLSEKSHVLIDGVVGNVGVGAIVQGDQDVQEH